jgi:hypothetical protein
MEMIRNNRITLQLTTIIENLTYITWISKNHLDKNCGPSLFRLSFYNYPFSMEICIFYLLYCHGEYKSLQLLNVLEQLLVLDWETALSDW